MLLEAVRVECYNILLLDQLFSVERCDGTARETYNRTSKRASSLGVCVNSATDALGLSHDGLSRHRAGLPAHLGAAVNKD